MGGGACHGGHILIPSTHTWTLASCLPLLQKEITLKRVPKKRRHRTHILSHRRPGGRETMKVSERDVTPNTFCRVLLDEGVSEATSTPPGGYATVGKRMAIMPAMHPPMRFGSQCLTG